MRRIEYREDAQQYDGPNSGAVEFSELLIEQMKIAMSSKRADLLSL